MTVRQALAEARQMLAEADVEDAPLEAEVLLRDVLRRGRAQLYLGLDRELVPREGSAFWRLVRRRIGDEPTAYILGRREFYGRDFLVDRRVLVPRPESELLVEQALKLAEDRSLRTVADVGTGCGAIAISLALALPRATVFATDISAGALEVARANCRRHGVAGRVILLRGDLLDVLPESVDMIVANLPYVRESELPRTGPVSAEPRLALDGGPDGLDEIRRLCSQAKGRLRSGGCLLLEIGEGQARAVTDLLRGLFPGGRIEVAPDLRGIDRVVSLELP